MQDKYKSVMYCQSARIASLISETPVEQTDFELYGYVLKVITQKSITNPNELEVWKLLVLTHEQDICCIEIADRGFILKSAFPKEGSYIFLDNL